MGGSLALGLPARASAAEGPERPATWDMSIEQLREIGLGQYRGDPVPVPAEYPQLNAGQRPTEGGVPPDPWIVFVNFDGEMLTAGMDSAQDNITQVPGMAGAFAPYGEGDKRAAVMQAVMTDWAAYNIAIVDERPASGEYVMNMTGPTNPFGSFVLGIAPLDCMNAETHSNITYAFHSVDDEHSAPITATTIGQEVAHSFGLEHVNEPADILNPVNMGGDPSFIDECLQLDGSQPIVCADQHLAFCPDGQGQNSHQELLALFGPAFVDTEPPQVLILSPFEGMQFELSPATVAVSATVDDNVEVVSATLRSDGVVVETLTEEPWQWTMQGVPEGVHSLVVTAVDPSGNEGVSNTVVITVGALPGGTDGDTDTDGAGQNDDDEGCGCRQGRPAPWAALGLSLLVLGLGRRRRIESMP